MERWSSGKDWRNECDGKAADELSRGRCVAEDPDLVVSWERGWSSDSRLAMRSMGIRTRRKKIERMAKPFAARVLHIC